MEPAAITALVLAVAGLITAVAVVVKSARRSNSTPPPPPRGQLDSVDVTGNTGRFSAVVASPPPGGWAGPGYPPVPAHPQLEGVVAELRAATAAIKGYATHDDLRRLEDRISECLSALEACRLAWEQQVRSHQSLREVVLSIREQLDDLRTRLDRQRQGAR